MRKLLNWFAVGLLVTGVISAAGNSIRHDLEVRIEPERHWLEVQDSIKLDRDLPSEFQLNAALEIVSIEPADLLQIEDVSQRPGPEDLARTYRLTARADASPPPLLTIRYRGQIHQPLEREAEEYARSFSRTSGIIGPEGVYLSGASAWIPQFGEDLVTFSVEVDLPSGWSSVSQGERTSDTAESGREREAWESPEPMDEVFLIAARFTEYSQPAGTATAQAFLRTPDPNLAAKYLEATAQYLDMYTRLLGPYPYKKFALVENFWESGYGMPSFTLLGPQVIRLPFILHSSYPHEILHNWWGNSVFVDYDKGNWCEGLTAYLADHLIREGQGGGTDYRRDTLKRYRDFVRGSRDFPLREFRARHSPSSEAVGYGKSLMLWHMLRIHLGDQNFTRGLATFYQRHRFTRATFDDLKEVFSEVSNDDLEGFFEQWVDRTGAPRLELGEVKSEETGGGYRASVEVRQAQEGPPYRLRVPLVFTVEGEPAPVWQWAEVDKRNSRFEVDLPARPLLVEVDPGYDVFRRLDRSEIPSSLGQLFGAEKALFLLPGDQDPIGPRVWEELARSWSEGQPERYQFSREDQIESLPSDRAVWILGSQNRWSQVVRDALPEDSGIQGRELLFQGESVPAAGHSYVLTVENPDNPEMALGWIGADLAVAMPGLARKLPHYNKYSYLAFQGEEPENVVKGQWATTDSPLVKRFAGVRDRIERAALPDRPPLARPEPVFNATRLMEHVERLTSPDLDGRGIGTQGLEQTAAYIAESFQNSGLLPGGEEGTFFQNWTEPDGPEGKPVKLKNVIGVLPGTDPELAAQSVVVAAHYDHLGYGWPDARSGAQGQLHPGADDNASGVAVLLELASLLGRQLQPKRTVVFVAFSGEEWELKGSRHYVRSMDRWPASKVIGAVNLDSVGHLGKGKILVLGSGTASEWVHINRGIGFVTGIPSESVGDDYGSSDQRAFIEAGVPAVQIFTGPHEHYHRPTDTADTIDLAGMVQVAAFVREAVAYLSEREEPLTSRIEGRESPAPAPAARGGGRRVSLGTLPDFSFQGPGVRIQSVLPDSPADKAGLAAGDLLLAIDGQEVKDLRSYAGILRSHNPGDRVKIRVRRGEEELELEAVLVAR